MSRIVNMPAKETPESRQAYLDNFERVFGKKGTRSGSYVQDRETGKLISRYDYWLKYESHKERAPAVIGDIAAYESPVNPGKWITSRRQERYELESTGCRVYEGKEQEMKEAQRFRDYEAKDFDRKLEHALRDTKNKLDYQMIKPETSIKSGWVLGED